jgi:hypothetical protein
VGFIRVTFLCSHSLFETNLVREQGNYDSEDAVRNDEGC